MINMRDGGAECNTIITLRDRFIKALRRVGEEKR